MENTIQKKKKRNRQIREFYENWNYHKIGENYGNKCQCLMKSTVRELSGYTRNWNGVKLIGHGRLFPKNVPN